MKNKLNIQKKCLQFFSFHFCAFFFLVSLTNEINKECILTFKHFLPIFLIVYSFLYVLHTVKEEGKEHQRFSYLIRNRKRPL